MPCKLLIVSSEEEHHYVVDALSHSAIPNWETSDQILRWIWSQSDQCLREVATNKIVYWNQVPQGVTILATKSVQKFPKDKLERRGCPTLVVSSSHYFTKNDNKFYELLTKNSLSWRSYAQTLYEAYDHRSKSFGVDDWLNQFAKIGLPNEVGQLILKMTRVMQADECIDIFCKNSKIQKNEKIATLSRMGKSGAALSGGLRRRFNRECVDLSACITECSKNGETHTIHVFEDGLWTGIELQRVIESLKGQSINEKLAALKDPSWINNHNIILYFAVGTDIGHFAAKSIIDQHNLTNFRIETTNSTVLKILTPEATDLFEKKELGFHDVADFKVGAKYVIPHLLQSLTPYRNIDQMRHIKEVIEEVGSQLWEFNHAGSEMLDAETRNHLAFGANGIGSLFAFRHSIPRASLPLLWASGPVKWGRKKFQWNALFPEKGIGDHIQEGTDSP